MSLETIHEVSRGEKVYSSERSLGIIRPIAYPQHTYDATSKKWVVSHDYEQKLQALHVATDGAFYEVPVGAQAITVVPSLRTAENHAAPKKGGIFDKKKAHDLHRSIASFSQSLEPIELEPIDDGAGLPFEIVRDSGGLRVNMVFEKSEQNRQAIDAITAHVGAYVLDVCGRHLHDEDLYALELARDMHPVMPVGYIPTSELSPELNMVAKEDPVGFFEVVQSTYEAKSGSLELQEAPLGMSGAKISFNGLKLAYISRRNGRRQQL